MRENILEASVRVLRREGALRFTTLRVAEIAGVSVGSLYQYFPNKQSLVFALHERAVQSAWIEVQRIIDHRRWSAREKIRRIVRLYFMAESRDVAEMGAALRDAEVFFADYPSYSAMRELVMRRFVRFVGESVPTLSPGKARFRALQLVTTIDSVGRAVAGLGLRKRVVGRWADDCAEFVANQAGFRQPATKATA